MQTRTPLNAAALLMAGALLAWLAASVRLATPVQVEGKHAASAGLDQTVRQLFALAHQHLRWELNDLARRLDEQPAAAELCEGLVPAPPGSPRTAAACSGRSASCRRTSGRSSTWCGSRG